MAARHDDPSVPRSIRQRTEEIARAEPSNLAGMSGEDVQRLVYELRLRQIDLERQNEDLRQALVALTHSRDHFAELYEFAPVGEVTIGPDGKVLNANLTAAAMLGVERRRLLQAKISDYVPCGSQDALHLHWQAAFSSEAKQTCELKIKKADGADLTVRLESVAVDGEEGRECRTAFVDITEQRAAEKAVRLRNASLEERVVQQTGKIALLAAAVSHLGEGVLITDVHLDWPGPQIIYVNEALCRITGYSEGELLGQSPRILQGDGADRKTLDRIKTELSAGRACLAEVVNYRKDGSAYNAELYIMPIYDANGARTNFVAIHRDVTERKRAEQALQCRKELLKAILDTATDAIINIDRRGVITNANPATERMFGYVSEELIGRNVSLLMPPPHCDNHDSYISRYLETGEARIIGTGRELMGRRKDGAAFPISLAVSQIDHLGLFTGIVRDISVVRNLQRALLEITEERNLRVGQELHDGLQQQLTGLGLLAQTVADRLQESAKKDAARSADSELSRKVALGLSEASRQVQLLARGLVPVDIDVHGLQAALARLASSVSEQYRVECVFRSDGKVELSDSHAATQLFRIAQEAVNNATKHSRASRIELSLLETDAAVALSISDNGVGIPEHPTGPGMGLRIMQYRARLIDAALQISPRQDGGTRVVCTLLRPQARSS